MNENRKLGRKEDYTGDFVVGESFVHVKFYKTTKGLKL